VPGSPIVKEEVEGKEGDGLEHGVDVQKDRHRRLGRYHPTHCREPHAHTHTHTYTHGEMSEANGDELMR
jgi:hypothetical protein